MTDRKLRIKQRSGYFCGMFGCNAAYSMVNTFLLMFYTDAMKLDAAQLSLMFLITKLVDGVTDYLVGCLIDRTDTKLGRNKPWMLYGIPVFVIGFLLVFAAPDFAASWRLAYAYLSYSIFCFGFTMVYVPMNSIVPFMTSDPDERTTILTYGNVGGSVGVLLAIVGVPAMIQINGGTSSISGYTRTALPLITISAAIYFFSVVLTKEENLPPMAKKESPWKNLRLIIENRPFLCLLGYMLFNALQLACMTSVLTYYAKYILFDEAQVTTLNLVFAVGNFIGLAFASPFGKRFSKRPLLSVLLVIQMLCWVGCWFAFDRIIMIYICISIMSLAAGVTTPNVYAVLSESVDYGEYKTGVNLAGTQTAIFGLFNKIGSAMASSLIALVLSLGHYDNTAAIQADSARFAIRFALSGVCFICAAACFASMLFYPITREKMKEIAKTLQERRQA